jgi:hypothetical protein
VDGLDMAGGAVDEFGFALTERQFNSGGAALPPEVQPPSASLPWPLRSVPRWSGYGRRPARARSEFVGNLSATAGYMREGSA